jgi:hypothetical protein
VNDLRAERRAIAENYMLSHVLQEHNKSIIEHIKKTGFFIADAIIQHDLDNPPEWEAVKDSLTVEGWTHHEERLPTEADAPGGYILVCDDYGFLSVDPLAGYLSGNGNRSAYPYWHPATGRFQIPKAPEVKSD